MMKHLKSHQQHCPEPESFSVKVNTDDLVDTEDLEEVEETEE